PDASWSGVLGAEIVSGEPDRVEATATWKAALCAFLNLSEGATTSTIESKTSFFRPVTSGSIRFVATPVNVGRRVIVVQTDGYNEEDKQVSRTTQSRAVMVPSP
ncbi:MAG: PaaI family thioesterase, partial [Acidimicrobiia bacterium]